MSKRLRTGHSTNLLQPDGKMTEGVLMLASPADLDVVEGNLCGMIVKKNQKCKLWNIYRKNS